MAEATLEKKEQQKVKEQQQKLVTQQICEVSLLSFIKTEVKVTNNMQYVHFIVVSHSPQNT